MRVFAPVLIVTLLLTAVTLAHDTWLVPVKFVCEPGEEVAVDLSTGMDYPVSLGAAAPDRIAAWLLRGAGAERQVTGYAIDGESLRATVKPDAPGTWMIIAATKPKLISLPAEEFNEYLVHDGLTRVRDLRAREGLLEQDAVERYSKYPKTLIQVGSVLDETPLTASGAIIEIVPLANPYRLTQGDRLPVQVLFRGAPLAGAEVAWSAPGVGESFLGTVISDGRGIAEVPLERSGSFVIRTITMERVRQPEYEWESFWASLTFAVRAE